MSEAPEDLRDLEQMHQDWLNAPTLSAAMQLPEVQALVDAAKRLAEWAEQLRACGDAGNWEWTAGDEYSETIAALSAAKGAADADR